MQYIKQFFSDSLNLPKHKFSQKYLLLPSIIFFGWAALAHLVELRYSTANLNLIEGKITTIEKIVISKTDKLFYKNIDEELRITLDNHPDYLRLTTGYDIDGLLHQLKSGNTIKIYYRKKSAIPFEFGVEKDIYQIEQGNKIVFNLSNRKKNSKNVVLVAALAVILLGGFWIYLRKKQKMLQNRKYI